MKTNIQKILVPMTIGAMVLGFLVSAMPANADVDPIGCTDNGGGISVAAFRADGITNIGVGTVVDGENINYKATLSALASPNCAFQGGAWTLTTPNGVVHTLGAVPRIGGTGVASFTSGLISYTVNHTDEIVGVTRHINASTSYSGGISHADAGDETDGPTLGSSKILKVIHTPNVTTDIHNAGHSVVTSVPAGTAVHDSATVAMVGGPVPTGTVTFTRFTDGSCDSGAVVGSPVALVAGLADGSATYTPVVSGSLSYKAHYNGDGNYNPADGACEPLTVTKWDSTTTTDIHNPSHTVITTASVGDMVHDNAHVTGGNGIATGTVSFQLYSDATCQAVSGVPQVVSLDGTGHAETSAVSAVVPSMSYKASYSGDGVYNASVGSCEPLTVTLKTPTVTTSIHNAAHSTITTATAGDTVHDSVTVTGSSPTPTGSVTFDWFANGNCSSTANSTSSTFALSGGTVDATTFAKGPLTAGSYSFKAHYAGDSMYMPGDGPCEPLTVSQLTPTVVTEIHTDSPDQVVVGSLISPASVHDKATVGGTGPVPTGTVDFTFYTDGACSSAGTPSGTGIALVSGVAHPSLSQTGLAAGSYSFKAHYNGDITYMAKDATCEPLTVVSQGHIIVDKVTNPSGDPTSFTFVTTGTGYTGFSLTNAAAPNSQTLNAGTYSVKENAMSGWIQTSAVCTDGNTSVNPASINLQAGHTVTCTFTNTKQVQWCSHGYWKQSQHFDSYVTYSPNQLFSSVFENAFPGMTLLQVLQQGGGGLNALGRDTVGELLNTAAGLNTGYTTSQIVSMFNAVYPGGNYDALHAQFVSPENCPLN